MTAVLADVDLGPQVAVRGAPPPGFPTEPNTTVAAGGRVVLWLGPDEWLVLGGREDDYRACVETTQAPGAAVDVSAARAGLRLAGPGAADVLAQGCSLDLHPSVFPPGRCAQTLVARAQVVVYRPEEDVYLLLVRTSFREYLRAWLEEALTDEDEA